MRTTRRWRWVIVGAALAIGLPVYVVAHRIKQFGWDYYLTIGPGHYFFGYYTIQSVNVDDASVRVIRDRRSWVYSAWLKVGPHEGSQPDSLEGFHWSLGAEAGGNKTIGLGENLTGNGRPNIIAMEWSGGAHCCCTYHVFEVGSDGMVREIAVIEARHGGRFEDRDGDGYPEFVTADWSLAYALSCFACITCPEIVLKFDGRTYSPAPQLMRAQSPVESDAEFVERLRADTKDRDFNRRDHTWNEMLKRIYSGHADLAWPLFDAAWEPSWGDHDKLLNSFIQEVERSPYADLLTEMNHGRWLPAGR